MCAIYLALLCEYVLVVRVLVQCVLCACERGGVRGGGGAQLVPLLCHVVALRSQLLARERARSQLLFVGLQLLVSSENSATVGRCSLVQFVVDLAVRCRSRAGTPHSVSRGLCGNIGRWELAWHPRNLTDTNSRQIHSDLNVV